MSTGWDRRFFDSTRGRIVTLLRRSNRVVEDLEALVGEVAGVSVREHCERGERPRCCFEIASAGDTAQT